VIQAEHPFVLEMRFDDPADPGARTAAFHARVREVTLLLSVLLTGRIEPLGSRSAHEHRSLWAIPHSNDSSQPPVPRWSQEFYFVPGAMGYDRHFTVPSDLRPLPTVDEREYYRLWHIAPDDNLEIPASLGKDINSFGALGKRDRERFLLGCYWLRHAARTWEYSKSLSMAALVIAIEAVMPKAKGRCPECNSPRPSISDQFVDFVRDMVLDWDVPGDIRKDIYSARSDILHGRRLLSFDMGPSFGPDTSRMTDLGRIELAWRAARIVLIEWLRRSRSKRRQSAVTANR
jgi:hypothetical protein